MLFYFYKNERPMIRLLYKLFTKKQASVTDETNSMKKFLIVGLGNIGEKYHETRHNIGFMILDHLAKEENITFRSKKITFTRVVKERRWDATPVYVKFTELKKEFDQFKLTVSPGTPSKLPKSFPSSGISW